MSDLNRYQSAAVETAVFPAEVALDYLVHGLVSEAGEVAGVRKKRLRGDYGDDEETRRIASELGDVLWYVACLARFHGLRLHEVAEENIAKLRDRQRRDVLTGSGDER